MDEIRPVVVGSKSYERDDFRQLLSERAAKLPNPKLPDWLVQENHLLGLVGELAVSALLAAWLPDGATSCWVADHPETASDIAVSVGGRWVRRLEVKTTTPKRWSSHGRIVHRRQIQSTDADAYVWCVAPRLDRRPSVHVAGWSTIDDVRAAWFPARFGVGYGPSSLRMPEALELPRPAIQTYNYDIDDVGSDEYEIEAVKWSAPDEYDNQVTIAEDHELNAVNELYEREWAEGRELLSGPKPVEDLARVTALIRPMGSLVAWAVE